MIIDKKLIVKIAKYNIEHYSQFFDVNLKDMIEIDTESHLQKNSNIKINVQCDICSEQRYIKYQAYTKNISSCIEHPIYTCDKCSHVKLKIYNKKKYGVEYYSQHPDRNEKVKKTCIEKYGVDHFSKTDDFKNKVEKTNLEKFGYINPFMDSNRIKDIFFKKYGVDHPSQVKEFYDKARKINLERYGFECVLSSPEVRGVVKKKNLEKFGYDHISMSENMRSKYKIASDINYICYEGDFISKFSCDEGHIFYIKSDNYLRRKENNISLCTVCNPIGDSRSIKEKDLFDFISGNYSGKIIQSYRDSLEIDIYLPELNIGFEFNGLYWHSEQYKEKSYHLDKTNYFMEKGIRIIHIWEDDWTFRRKILESQVKNLLGKSNVRLFARKCYVKELKTVSEFLNVNHIQGIDRSKHKIGLFHDDELVSVMTFNCLEGRNKMNDDEYNLSRFCNKLGYNIVGGASKMLKWFINEYKPKRIISYADKDWSVGGLYYTLGFELMLETKPDYKYIIGNERKHKQNFKKKNLKIDGNITESKYMNERNINKIYDCGKIKFEKLL